MKKYFFYGIILCLMGGFLTEMAAQKSIGIPPFSQSEEFKEVQSSPPVLELAAPDMQQVLDEDLSYGWNRTGVPIAVNLDINSAGNWTALKNGGKLWQLKIKVKNAKGLMLEYSAFKLPKEATLHLYNADQTQILGAYSSINNINGGAFSTDMIRGEEITMEYFQPADCQGVPELIISEVNYMYQENLDFRCENIGINCPEGEDWQTEKKGVVRIRMKFNNGQFSATGVIVNNTNKDGLAYVLTSYNKLLTPQILQGSIPQFENFIFYFNEEIEECDEGGLANNYSTMVGCQQIAAHDDTDFLLLRIDGEIPETPHDPRYLGWNRTSTAPSNATSIYQSVAGFKEIAFENDNLQIYPEILSTSIIDYPANHFFNIGWDNGHTENGGQGAPIFDISGNVRGWMTVPNSCGANEAFAARLNTAWHPQGTSPEEQLEPWLDPVGQNPTQLNGLHVTSPGGGSGSCCGSSNMISQGNVAVLGEVAKFISSELRGNYKLLEESYIENHEAINKALTSSEPKYRTVQNAVEAWLNETRRTFFRAFIFDMENKVSERGLKTGQKVLEEMAKVIPTDSFQEMVNKVTRLMNAAKGKDLKSGLIAFDRANLDDFPPEFNNTNENAQLVGFQVQGNPDATPLLRFSLPETGRVSIQVFDLNGKLLTTALDAIREEGKYYLPLNGTKIQSGLKLVTMTYWGSEGVVRRTKKVVVGN